MVFNKGKKEVQFPVCTKEIYYAISEVLLNTIIYQEEDESFDADSIIYESLSSKISNDESIEAVKWFTHDKVFYEASHNKYAYTSGPLMKEVTTNVLFKGANYDEEFNRVRKLIEETYGG